MYSVFSGIPSHPKHPFFFNRVIPDHSLECLNTKLVCSALQPKMLSVYLDPLCNDIQKGTPYTCNIWLSLISNSHGTLTILAS